MKPALTIERSRRGLCGLGLRAVAAMVVVFSAPSGSGAIAQDSESICTTEAVWVNCFEGLSVSPGANRTATLHLRAHVAEGNCLPARVALTAAFIDRQGTVLCMGTHDEIAVLDSNMPNRNVHDVSLEVNPLVLRTFARWRNRPGQRMEVMFEPLQCRSPDGRTGLLDNQLESAAAVQIAATLLPCPGGALGRRVPNQAGAVGRRSIRDTHLFSLPTRNRAFITKP